MFLFNWNF